MAKTRGWERMLYYGTVGSTAATPVTAGLTDIQVNVSGEYYESTDRGAGTTLPKKTESVVCNVAEVTFSGFYDSTNAPIVALIAAARTKTAKAIKVVRKSGGETEFDGDCYLDMSSPGALKDGMPIEFTAHPTDDGARAWTVG